MRARTLLLALRSHAGAASWRRSPFVAVEVVPAPTARLPNGVELVLGELDARGARAAGRDAGRAAMSPLNPALAVYVHRDPVDFRKNVNGLVAIIDAAHAHPHGERLAGRRDANRAGYEDDRRLYAKARSALVRPTCRTLGRSPLSLRS